ncbi:MAG: hypothetical protein ACOY90_12910 [Candidatus Zhuqueibacterota bacterium]
MKFKKLLFAALFFLLFFSSALLSQDEISHLKVTGKLGILLAADRGAEDGIEIDWVYDMKRIVMNDTFHVGTAVVSRVEPKMCYLKPFFVSPFRARENDDLFKNVALTESLMRTKSNDFWNEIQSCNAGVGNLDFIDGRNFRNCVITMKDGVSVKVKDLIVKANEGILIPQKYTTKRELVPIEGIQSIKTSTGNYALFGAVIGASIGGGAVLLLHQSNVELDTTYYFVSSLNQYGNIIGWSKMMKVVKKDHRLPMFTRIAMVSGGYLLGSIIGYAFKGNYKEIYSSGKWDGKMSLNWNITQPWPDAIGINLNLCF